MKNKKIFFTAILICFSFAKSFSQFTPLDKNPSPTGFTGKPQYQILTTKGGNFLGVINVELFPAIAPLAVWNFDSLVSKQFYDTTAFHRVIPTFVIQGGDPNSRHGPKSTWGYGDPSQPTVNAEFSVAKHLRGTLAAARDANINSANSQFYICVAPQPGLDGQYTIYGQVISGIDVVDTIVNQPRDANDCPLIKIEMFVTYTGSNDTVPNSPLLKLPADGTQNVGTTKLLQWFSVSDAIYYHIQVSTDSTFAAMYADYDISNLSYTVGPLQGSTTYYWRVKTNNGGHWSAYSPLWKFSTTMNASVNNLAFIEKGFKLEQNIPNPVSGQTTINYSTPGQENILIKLFNAEGKEVAVLVNEKKSKGEYSVVVDMNKFAAGNYFYRMQAGNVSDTKKLIIEK